MLSERDRLTIFEQYVDAMIWAHSVDDIDRIMNIACNDADIETYHFVILTNLAKSFRERLGMVRALNF